MDNSLNPSNAFALVRPDDKVVTVTKTRPANTTTYTAGQTVSESTSAGTVWTFANMARFAGGGGTILRALFINSVAAALKPELELYLFDTAPTTTLNDAATWAPTDAEMKTCIGMISFFSGFFQVCLTGTGGNGIVPANGLGLNYQCAAADTSLYGVSVMRNAYIPPSNSEDLTMRLFALRS